MPRDYCANESNPGPSAHTQDCMKAAYLALQVAEALFCKTGKDAASRHAASASTVCMH